MESPQAQKNRSGWQRVAHAAKYSLAGLRAGWAEASLRQEYLLCLAMIPLACWIGQTWLERSVLIATAFIVVIVELLNTAIEKTIDRAGLEWHALAKTAKDMGSAAVFLALLLCLGVWAAAVYARWA